ncbi:MULTISPECIES: diaminopropionate ammonia-lyase [Lonsdalea]|uniref:PLP-dependent lyase/thiolase n=2 Tax=Lonsdalea TaxID=1082702 RepID=A0ACD1J9W5_9GAMM|nr:MULTISPECIES: diaminopropionate ammonia-lyase [Lonsdalea]OSM95693.1 PLP-dependent lyase/thiolase [Lonsdalea populi]QPQ23139.1 diaminopropionate ammonia-lyase [Lonsdalea populi]RAT11836.1 PLP-dependent lyase/thiolase [Lonsdalea quercina]RAT21674.1 PLP-dependent lyase/thiolase [Lonsdalea populi]RAT22387.1 PLP-dependent lyase/thiolase [Lonsdalea populi]
MSTFSLRMRIADNAHFTPRGAALFGREQAEQARAFHRRMPGYAPTPLYSLEAFAAALGVGRVWVKDESQRFGLNAFKILGGAYAIARCVCEKYHLALADFSFEQGRAALPERLTFATTTDGNHGRGVAWAANALGQRAVVYMPKGASAERVAHITRLGAECIVTDMNYDDTVRLTLHTAQENGWEVVQDTAWSGYEKIPAWIMQGYGTLAVETVEQIAEREWPAPTHVFLQAGVGAMAAGVLDHLVDRYGAESLHTAIVEPERADCLFRSAQQGEIVALGGAMDTMMAGLACGEPNPLGWPRLRDCARQFISCEDRVTALGMRVLGNPLGRDPRIVSGESGAVGMGVLAAILHSPQRQALMDRLRLDASSCVLAISSEGDTDRQHYREVVWEGLPAMR